MSDTFLWQTKLAARLHDPAEKALVLMRDPCGHENGTSRALARLLGYHELPDAIDPDNDEALVKLLIARTGFGSQIPQAMYRHVQRADWWAAAADRPQWPMREITVTTKAGERKTLAVDPHHQVRWTERPQLVHPLTGESLDLKKLGEVHIETAKQTAFEHFSEMVVALGARDEASTDWRKLALAFWRFGPELREAADMGKFGALWSLLPADTRVPDHSIWEHLDLTSAFAGAFATDPQGEVALLTLSIGPVQGFIAQARKLDDLWAGSHLLSRLAWETMRPLAEALGPDAILFPKLRGLAQVDLWLRDKMKLPDSLFEGCEWKAGASDANPLFAAALPNRFVAVVPASRARELADQCAQAARAWIKEQGKATVNALLDAIGHPKQDDCPAYAQMCQQLTNFPEVHWAVVPFSLIRCRNAERQQDLELTALREAMAPFFGGADDADCGFLASPAWTVLSQAIEWNESGNKVRFFAPNPGVLYPAIFDLAERALAAAKAARSFNADEQTGWRDSLSGEVEWLTLDREQLRLPPGQRKDTLWTRVAKRHKAWAKEGEHLGGLAALKRLWPTLFAKEVAKALGKNDIGRFTVSTHTMALAAQLDDWLRRGAMTEHLPKDDAQPAEQVALPRRLVRQHAANADALKEARRLPALLDLEDDAGADRAEKLRNAVRKTLATAVKDDQRARFRLETYYGLLMLDGDRMGAILGGEGDTAIRYRDSFHEQVRAGFDRLAREHPEVRAYGEQRRAVSPGRHLAISSALNDFSQHVARHVVEEEHLGRLIYAGGDDVLAVLPVRDLLSCALRLRHAYSGTLPEDQDTDWGELRKDASGLHCRNGFAWLKGRLMRMMGKHATASAGLIVAHHQAPLGAVLRELRAAEKRAKHEGKRDAFCLSVIKRSGGRLGIALKWADLPLLERTIAFLADDCTSRRAVYHSLAWLSDLPDPAQAPDMVEALLAEQFRRQSNEHPDARPLARELVALAATQAKARDWLANLLGVAEFLAREVRQPLAAGGDENADARQKVPA